MHKHVQQLEEMRKYQEAPLLLELYRQEPLAEDVLQRYLQNAYLTGQRDNALNTFNQSKALLKKN